MLYLCRLFLADQRGATAIEYALICGCIFLAIVSAVTTFSVAVTNMFNTVSTAMSAN
jgi:pilus assembly protein Flp/PilA